MSDKAAPSPRVTEITVSLSTHFNNPGEAFANACPALSVKVEIPEGQHWEAIAVQYRHKIRAELAVAKQSQLRVWADEAAEADRAQQAEWAALSNSDEKPNAVDADDIPF